MCQLQSLWNAHDRGQAIECVKRGEPVGIFNRGVCGIWIDGTSAQAVQRVQAIKGEQHIRIFGRLGMAATRGALLGQRQVQSRAGRDRFLFPVERPVLNRSA